MRFYSPSNLELVPMLKERGYDNLVKHVWKLYYVMTVVYNGRWIKSYEKDEYVPVNFGIVKGSWVSQFARRTSERWLN